LRGLSRSWCRIDDALEVATKGGNRSLLAPSAMKLREIQRTHNRGLISVHPILFLHVVRMQACEAFGCPTPWPPRPRLDSACSRPLFGALRVVEDGQGKDRERFKHWPFVAFARTFRSVASSLSAGCVAVLRSFLFTSNFYSQRRGSLKRRHNGVLIRRFRKVQIISAQ